MTIRCERSGRSTEALSTLQRKFGALYSPIGRPSIPPEKLQRAMLLQAFLFDPLGAAFDGAAGIRPAVPLVHRNWRRRRARIISESRGSQ